MQLSDESELQLDDHNGEEGVPAVAFSMGALEAIEADIGAVATAIEALEQGTYGRCVDCAAPIGPTILATDVLAARCAAHRTLQLSLPRVPFP